MHPGELFIEAGGRELAQILATKISQQGAGILVLSLGWSFECVGCTQWCDFFLDLSIQSQDCQAVNVEGRPALLE